MKLFLRRTVILLLLLTIGTVHYAQAQSIGAGDLVFTGINIFDDDVNGSVQNDAFSFVLLRDCPANTTIWFTDLGWTGFGFQSVACTAGTGSQTDGIIEWSSGPTALRAGRQIVIFCKYTPTATIGTVTAVRPTAATSGATVEEYISLGLAGDQLFAFTGSVGAPVIIGGINVNRNTWESALAPCDFSSSSSLKPATTAVLNFPSINAVNAKYNCSTLLGVPASLRSQIQDTTKWDKDYTLSTSFPASFNLKTITPCQLTVVVPDANGIVYVNNQSLTPGSGASWAMPLPELRDALAAAAITNSGIKQIWVAKGTYKPTADAANRLASFNIPAGVAVYGGFAGNETMLDARDIPANPVILSGDIDNNDQLVNGIALRPSDVLGNNSYHVITVSSAGAARVLDGVIVTGGDATHATLAEHRSGGGIYKHLGDITITHTRFYGNRGAVSAGALYNSGGAAQLANCVFFGNGGAMEGGAIEGAAGDLQLTNITISGNFTTNGGAGVAISGGNFIAYNTIITGNLSSNSLGDISYSGAGTQDAYYTILGDRYYTNSTTSQPTAPVVFTGFATGDLRLSTVNYGINKGDPQTNVAGYAAQAGTKDLAGQSRISNTIIDLGAYEIQAVPQTITFPAIPDLTYGDQNIDPGATTTGDGTIIYTSDNTAVAEIVSGMIKTTGAGTAVITANAPATNIYLPAGPITRTITVNKKPLTIKADDVSRPYGSANPDATFSYSGFAYSEDATVLTGTPTAVFGATPTSNVGSYPITTNISGVSGNNYELSADNGILTVTKATQSITLTLPSEASYGVAPFTLPQNTAAGLPIVYTVSGPASISGNTLSITGAGEVTLTANQPGDANHLAAATVSQTITIAKAVLTVRANNKTRPYKVPDPVLNYLITGFVNGDNESVVSGTAALSTSAVLSSAPGFYPINITAGSLSAANYTFSFLAGTLTIIPASQTISFPAIADKAYGDPAFTLNATSSSGLGLTYSVVSGAATISGNTVTITGAGAITIAADQAGDANYTPAAQETQSFNVSKALLTVSADDKTKRYLEANPVLDYTITGFVYNEDNSVVSGDADITTTAAVNSTPGTYPITITAGDLAAANYTFNFVNATLTVTQATQTINFPAISDKTYGDPAFALNATSSSGLGLTYSVVSGPATVSGNTVTITGAGTVTIAADQAGDANYLAATQATQTFTVNKAVLSVSANDKTKIYLQANPALDYTITGFVNSEDNSVVSGTADITTTAVVNSTSGTYPITVTTGSLAAANYSFSFVKATLTVTQATQTISFPAIADKTYGDPAFALNATSSSGLAVTYSVVSGPAAISGNTVTITGTGTVTIAADQPGDANYTAAAQLTQSFNVNKAVLTVTANDKTKIYLEPNPALDYIITGFVYNEDNTVISGAPMISTTATAGSPIGTYSISITAGTLSAANYLFTTVNGTLTIDLASQAISFPAISDKTYGDAAFALSATSSSGLAISYSVVSGPAIMNGNTLTITGAGTITIAANQSGNANYAPAAPVTQSFNVAKAALTVTAINDTRTYNGMAYTGGNGVNYTGFVNGDNAASLSGSISYTGTSQGAVNAGTYVITPAGLSSSNYNLAYADAELTITRATQYITFTAPANKNQGDPDFTLTATASSGLPVTLVSSNPQVISLNGNTAQVGITGSAVITASQAGDSNYEPASSVTQTIQVNAWPTPEITAQGSTTLCAGGTLVLQSSEAPAYEWYRDGILVPGADSRTLTVDESGSYTVKAIYAVNADVTSAAVTVRVNPLPVGDIQVSGNTTISKGETIRLTASGGSTYNWSPVTGLSNTNTAAVSARPEATVTYQVSITSAAGCSITKEVTITVKEDFKLEATNILSPNGDGRNDLWVVKNIDMYPQNEVKIFDRAGRIIYRRQHYANNWDGKLNGQPLAEGTYYYIVDLGDDKPKFKGFITIIHDK